MARNHSVLVSPAFNTTHGFQQHPVIRQPVRHNLCDPTQNGLVI